MKINKGDAGYIKNQKLKRTLKTCIEFGLVAALLILGIIETGTRLNLLTVFAVLGCLPASKSLVGLIMMLPHRSIKKEKAKQIEEKGQHLVRVYDMVFTSEKKIMPVDSIVIFNQSVCGFTSREHVDTNFVTRHLKEYLENNGYKGSVKIFNSYPAFLVRVEGMDNMAAIDHFDKESADEIRQILLSLSL